MTTPAHSPLPDKRDEEPCSQGGPAVEKKARRLYWLWGIALTLLLALGLFCWLVVVPVWQVKSALGSADVNFVVSGPPWGMVPAIGQEEASASIERLGGPKTAANRLWFFLQLPVSLTGAEECLSPGQLVVEEHDTYAARGVVLLCHCGKDALPKIVSMLNHDDRRIRMLALYGIFASKLQMREVIPPVKAALNDEDKRVREAAAVTLKQFGHFGFRPKKPRGNAQR